VGRVRVQVAGITSARDALLVAEAGADAVGFTIGLPKGAPDDTPPEAAAAAVRALPPFVTPVLITYRSEAEEVARLLEAIGARTVQLHGGASEEAVARLRALVPGVKVVRVVHVTGPEAVAEATTIADADALLLDTFDPITGRRGATGKTHDWRISAAIVRSVRVPVILAGGLRPENVAEAIRTVQPWGVDVHTGVEDAWGRLDPARLQAFLAAVAAAPLGGGRPHHPGVE
jgi:phosphoribosylanthranilate isomerase